MRYLLLVLFFALHGLSDLSHAQTARKVPYSPHNEARALMRQIPCCEAYFRLGRNRIYINIYGVPDKTKQDEVIRTITAARDTRSTNPVRLTLFPRAKVTETVHPMGKSRSPRESKRPYAATTFPLRRRV